MPTTPSYYPSTNDGRAPWWQNILDVGSTNLTAAGLPAGQVTSILADA